VTASLTTVFFIGFLFGWFYLKKRKIELSKGGGLVIKANLVDIEKREIYPVKVTVEKGRIKRVRRIETVCDTYILPGFIDAHIHIESSMLVPTEFARVAVTHGTVATVSDPHEIANVLGVAGVEYMLQSASQTPFKFYFGASPCVPVTPYETNGAVLDPAAVASLLARSDIYFLSEVMNFPGVIAGDEDMMAKIAAAKKVGKPIDGHAPGLRGEELDAYIAAGINTDHEAYSYEEGLEKLKKGMKILVREGSAAKNFDALEPLIAEHWEHMMFCSDDRHPDDLKREHVNAMVIRALERGHDLFHVLQMACVNPVGHYGLDVGLLKEGDPADFIEVADLERFAHLRTVIGGETVARNGQTLLPRRETTLPNCFEATLKTAEDFALQCTKRVEVIEAIDHELVTHESVVTLHEGACCDPKNDILKIAVINRYDSGAPVAVAHVRGFGLTAGAIASSVAHDSHNVIVVGTSDAALAESANLVIAARGGIAAIGGGERHLLPLPVAGLMNDGDGFEVAGAYEQIDRFVKETLGSRLESPFMTLSFMALLVIPELKLSDKGLFDGSAFHFISACKQGEV
jgi:adenine deaminase